MGDWTPIRSFSDLETPGREFYVTPEDDPVPTFSKKANATFTNVLGVKMVKMGGKKTPVAPGSFGSSVQIDGENYDVYHRAKTGGRRSIRRGKTAKRSRKQKRTTRKQRR